MINLNYISDILEFIKEKNYEKITDIIRTKNNDLIQKKNETRRNRNNEIAETIHNLNNEIEELKSSLDKLISESESSEKAKSIIIIYIKNIKRKRNEFINLKKTM